MKVVKSYILMTAVLALVSNAGTAGRCSDL